MTSKIKTTHSAEIGLRSVEEIFEKVGFGAFQKLLFLFGGLFTVPHAMPNYIMYFAAQPPSWKCITNSSTCFYNGTLTGEDERRCTVPRDQWTYAGQLDTTLVTKFDLVCDSKWWIPMITTAFFLGYAIGSILFGWLADKCGRKKVVFICSGLEFFVGFSIAFSPNIYILSIFRFLSGFLKGGVCTNFMVLISEFSDRKHRPLSVLFVWGFNVIGSVTLATTAYFVREWKNLFIWTTAPYFLLIFFYPVVPESVRWLLINGKQEEAKAVLDKISKLNKTDEISLDEIMPCHTEEDSQKSEDSETINEDKAETIKCCEIISTIPLFKITFLQATAWAVVGILYFGLSLGADNFKGSIYSNFIFISITELPAQIIGSLLSHRFGRKSTVVLPLMVSGIMCLLLLVTIDGNVAMSVLIASLGKFFVSICNSGQCNWAQELYPTSMRSEGLGFVFFMLTFGGMAAPWVFKSMQSLHPRLPYIFMGVLCILVAALQLNLPETKGRAINEKKQRGKEEGKEDDINFLIPDHQNDSILS